MTVRVPESFKREMHGAELNRIIETLARTDQRLDQSNEIGRQLLIGIRDLLIYKSQAQDELERSRMLKWPLAAFGVFSGLIVEDVYDWLRSDAAFGAWVQLPALPVTALLIVVLVAGILFPLMRRRPRAHAVTALDIDGMFNRGKGGGGPSGSSGSGGGSTTVIRESTEEAGRSLEGETSPATSSGVDSLVSVLNSMDIPVSQKTVDARKARRRQDLIGRRLREMYAEVTSEPLPDEVFMMLEADASDDQSNRNLDEERPGDLSERN